MIYTFGIYLKFKFDEVYPYSPAGVAFAIVTSQTEKICLLTEQVTALALKASHNHLDRNRGSRNDRHRPRNDRDRNPRNDRDHNDLNDRRDRGRNDRSDRVRNDAQVFDGCGKTSHLLRNCLTFTDYAHKIDCIFPAPSPVALCFSYDFDQFLLIAVDSGARRQYSSIASDFDLIPRDDLGVVSSVDCLIRGIGKFPVSTIDPFANLVCFTLLNVLYVPDLPQRCGGIYLRLFGVHLAVATDLKCTFTASRDFLSLSSGLNVDIVRHRGLTRLPVYAHEPALFASVASSTRDLIHRRSDHLHEVGLLKLDNLEIHGVSGFSKLSSMFFCPDCATAKSIVADLNRHSTCDRDPPRPFHTIALYI